MPYIQGRQRYKLDSAIDELVDRIVTETTESGDKMAVAGLLNYTITRLILSSFGLLFPSRKYFQFPLIKGILADIRDEVQDRIQRDYENGKIADNGDLKEFV